MADTMGGVVLLLTKIVALQPVEPSMPQADDVPSHALDRAYAYGRACGLYEAQQLALEALRLFVPGAVLYPKEPPKEGAR